MRLAACRLTLLNASVVRNSLQGLFHQIDAPLRYKKQIIRIEFRASGSKLCVDEIGQCWGSVHSLRQISGAGRFFVLTGLNKLRFNSECISV